MPQTYLSIFQLGDVTVRYPIDRETNRVGLELVPTALLNQTIPRRETLRGQFYIDALPGNFATPAYVVESLVQFKVVGDSYPAGFAQGHTLRNSGSTESFADVHQESFDEDGCHIILTRLTRRDGCSCEHRLSYRNGDQAFEISSAFKNGSNRPVTLEMLSSFSLSGITPFENDDAPDHLRVHRFRSAWSAEGRLETRTLEQLHLERSWIGVAAFSERFGQLGTMPVRRWFPFVAVEDTAAGVLWGAQLAWAGSWQMEIFRQHDDVSISGGLADREFGHWLKKIDPGQNLITPVATVTCVAGTLDDLCDRLTAMQDRAVNSQPAIEQDLPIVFNEWCTTWGDPSDKNIDQIARWLHGSDVSYLVIDAGWYKTADSDWSSGHGDWVPGKELFPDGLKAVADKIRAQGLIPGLWFEMETVGEMSSAFSLVDHLLQRDGTPITVRQRRFWNLNDPWAFDYLTRKVIDLLESCGFGYLKIDYNETAGLGSEHPDSLGEGLRLQVEGIYRFLEKIRERLPDLVIENCSSGGHRLEPSMLGRTAMSSFSDAHELVEIPIIAANLHSLMLPRQSQIWAVLHPADSLKRLHYSLAATFLGRMCLSGDIIHLSPEHWSFVQHAMSLYRQISPTIKYGKSRLFGKRSESWRHPRGWQAMVREGESLLVVVHAFAEAPEQGEIKLPTGSWSLQAQLVESPTEISENGFKFSFEGDFSANVFILRKS